MIIDITSTGNITNRPKDFNTWCVFDRLPSSTNILMKITKLTKAPKTRETPKIAVEVSDKLFTNELHLIVLAITKNETIPTKDNTNFIFLNVCNLHLDLDNNRDRLKCADSDYSPTLDQQLLLIGFRAYVLAQALPILVKQKNLGNILGTDND